MSREMTDEQRDSWERLRARTSWTDEGLRTARNDLIEHGVLYITDDERLKAPKVAVLDNYLWDTGIRFHRTRTGSLQKYELVEVKAGYLQP